MTQATKRSSPPRRGRGGGAPKTRLVERSAGERDGSAGLLSGAAVGGGGGGHGVGLAAPNSLSTVDVLATMAALTVLCACATLIASRRRQRLAGTASHRCGHAEAVPKLGATTGELGGEPCSDKLAVALARDVPLPVATPESNHADEAEVGQTGPIVEIHALHSTAESSVDRGPRLSVEQRKRSRTDEVQSHPLKKASPFKDFQSFQRQYLTVFLLCTFCDWLKGPYVYALYEEYGYSTHDIATLFIGGFLSSLVFGTFVGSLSDKYGRKRMCYVFCVVYAISALTKPINSFVVLFIGRVLSGIATSLLFTSFESWMVSQHRAEGFDEGLMRGTFTKITLGNAVAAILAGLVAQLVVWLWGNAAPFLTAVPILLLSIWLMRNWPENYGNQNIAVVETLVRGAKAIRSDRPLQLLGATQAVFEGCMFLWVFIWTPCLDTTGLLVPFGLVFATYMLGMMIGGTLSDIFPVDRVLLPVHTGAMVSMVLAALFFHTKLLVLWSFVAFEFLVGVYFSIHGTLRSHYIEEASRSAVMNIFRVPLNVLVFVALQVKLTPRGMLVLLAVGHASSTLFLIQFRKLAKVAP